MTFKDSLHIMSTDFFPKLIFPDKAMGLMAQKASKAFEELQVSFNSCSLVLAHLCVSFESSTWWR